MGLYNTIFGTNPAAPVLIALLHSPLPTDDRMDFGRLRDAWAEKHGDEVWIRVHTRNGGGNRDEYQGVLDELAKHPWWVKDEDDDYDSTYADIYFRVSADWLAEVPDLVEVAVEPVVMADRWQAAVDAPLRDYIAKREAT
jgi:hypothetical protein